MNLKQIMMAPVLLASLLLTGCGSDSDTENDTSGNNTTGEFGGLTLSAERRGAAPFIELDAIQSINPALGVYKYSGTDGQELIGTLEVPDDKDYDLYFYDENGDRVAMVETSGDGIDETLEYTIDGFTTLYIVIYDGVGSINQSGGGNYSFTLSLIGLTEINEDDTDNDTLANAQEISRDSIISGDLNRPSLANCEIVDCDDYYILDVVEGDTLSLSLTGDDATNFDLYLFQLNGTYINHSENSDSSETLEYTIPNSMNQLVVSILAYAGTGDYELTIQAAE